MVDFREVELFINKERVNQLCVVGVAAERFWELAFHERRGLNDNAADDALKLARNQKKHAKAVKLLKGARCKF